MDEREENLRDAMKDEAAFDHVATFSPAPGALWTFPEDDWEYTVAYVDTFSGRRSYERPRYDGRNLAVAEAWLAERKQGNSLWADSVVVRRRRTEWEDVPPALLSAVTERSDQ